MLSVNYIAIKLGGGRERETCIHVSPFILYHLTFLVSFPVGAHFPMLFSGTPGGKGLATKCSVGEMRRL